MTPNPALSDNTFPENWQGTWRGIMYDRHLKGKSQIVPMMLRIKAISQNPIRYTWQITYGTGAKKIVRNYELVAKNLDTGHFVIDEKDGTLIDTWWFKDKLYSQFRLGNQLISTAEQLQGNKLHYELVAYQFLTPQIQVSEQNTSFESYQLRTVQSADLSFVKE
ncbi:hypothetical protein [Nostoc sp. MS1]|uniref:hypothetical protein n=1 Tax=Nostoc sp. MS1 TaxID=2764711 RepID=UPI001CC365FA|nr:hypothetical protein [Nostoc sp. MS1]